MIRGFFLFLILLVVQSCSTPTTISGRPNSDYHDRLYNKIRKDRLYTLDKVLYETKAVYFDENLTKMYVDEYAKRYRLPASDKAKMLADELKDLEENHVFYISHFATQKEAAKLGKASSTWRLTLMPQNSALEGEDEVESRSTKTLDSDDPFVQYFFPFVTPWSTNYRVMFPKSFEPPLELRISGVYDHVNLRWKE